MSGWRSLGETYHSSIVSTSDLGSTTQKPQRLESHGRDRCGVDGTSTICIGPVLRTVGVLSSV